MYMYSADMLLEYGAAIRTVGKMLKRINANILTTRKFLKVLDRDTSSQVYVARIEACIVAMRGHRDTTENIESAIRADFADVLGQRAAACRDRLAGRLADMRAASEGAELELSSALAIMCTSKLP